MQKQWIILFGALVIHSCAACGASVITPRPPGKLSACELLKRFADTQAQLKSFVVRSESSLQDEVFTPQPGKTAHWSATDTFLDGHQVSFRSRMWGHLPGGIQKSKDKPYYQSRHYDGQWRYAYEQSYWQAKDAPSPRVGAGMLVLDRVKQPKDLIETLGACQSGYCGFLMGLGVLPHDNLRIDARLGEAALIRVRDGLELAGAARSPCYVLEADTPHGYYTVWLDPAHGYQMARGTLQRRPGHQRGGWTLQAGESDRGFVDQVRFEKFGDVWVAVELSGGLDNTFVGGHRSSRRFQTKVSQFLLNPRPEALGSFVPDDIRDGAVVYAPGLTNANGTLIRCHWQDGRVVDSAGKIVMLP